MASFNIGDSRVIESREVSDGVAIRRRRETPDGRRFTTYERVEKPNLIVTKKNGSRELFDRVKLAHAVRQSVGKFLKSDEEVESIITAVEDKLYALGASEVPSRQIGEFVLDELAKRNEVAYVRFASVFQKFETLDDFVKILEQRRQKGQESCEQLSCIGQKAIMRVKLWIFYMTLIGRRGTRLRKLTQIRLRAVIFAGRTMSLNIQRLSR